MDYTKKPEKEKEPGTITTGTISDPNSSDFSYDSIPRSRNIFERTFDSYKPPPDDYKYDLMSAQDKALMYIKKTDPPLFRRHLFVIALSSCVGTGLFIGSGSSLVNAGAAGLVLAFIIMGSALLCTMSAAGELGLKYPTVNVFYELAGRFIHPSWGFAVGWLYAFSMLVTVPLELIAAAELTQYWHGDNNSAAKVNPIAWVALLYVFCVVIQLSGSRVYGELEFIIGAIKITAVIGFILFSLINVCGGPPTNHYIGASMWYKPSPFRNHFKGFVTALTSSAYAYGGTEVSTLASAETHNPVKAIPSTVKQAFWRIVVLFIISLLFVTLMVASNTPGLGNSNEGSGSPFISAISQTGVRALPSIFNAVIMCSVIGVSNAATYGCSRTLVSLAIKKAAPKQLCYIDRRGRPLVALAVVLIFALLSFVSASDKYNDVFNWLYAFGQLSFLFAWTSLCLCHLRFRRALKVQGRSPKELIFKSPFGIWGSIYGAFIVFATLCLQVWTYLFPIDKKPDAVTFFQGDLSIPCIIVLFLGHKFWFWRTSTYTPTKDLEIDYGERIIDHEALEEAMRQDAIKNKKNPIRMIASFLC